MASQTRLDGCGGVLQRLDGVAAFVRGVPRSLPLRDEVLALYGPQQQREGAANATERAQKLVQHVLGWQQALFGFLPRDTCLLARRSPSFPV